MRAHPGFDIITWRVERADLRHGGDNAGFHYFDQASRALKEDSDMY